MKSRIFFFRPYAKSDVRLFARNHRLKIWEYVTYTIESARFDLIECSDRHFEKHSQRIWNLFTEQNALKEMYKKRKLAFFDALNNLQQHAWGNGMFKI